MSSAEIEAASLKVLECFGACAAAPDDLEAGATADRALGELDQLLRAAENGAS